MNNIKHIGFIMDGNGRWSKQQLKPRSYGHLKGVNKIKDVVEWCIQKNIFNISLYAFSLENWKRPFSEVSYLMELFLEKISNNKTIEWFNKNQIKFIWTGFKENIDQKILIKINELSELTKNNKKCNLQIFFNYGSQQYIISCFKKLKNLNLEFNFDNINRIIDSNNLGPLDLVIRTANEHRLSNFMLWEVSYSELLFSKLCWPEYTKEEFENNINEYYKRIRKFGGLL